jgi:arylformamidase
MHNQGKILDITVTLRNGMPLWPGSAGFRLSQSASLKAGDPVNVSRMDCDVHVGTHVDAPIHFIEDGAAVDELSLDILVGPCFVAHLPQVKSIGSTDLAGLGVPVETRRLLLRTGNSKLWASQATDFKKDYVALTVDAARWIVERQINLIGLDYLSVQRYQDDPAIHRILLEKGVVILEGLNLSDVRVGKYELICLPIKLAGAEAAPARVVLRSITDVNVEQFAS